ncbi:lasso peptide biosynthesis B2 protein [Saccharopolyspora cebuensis]|uniref:Lasso peptide biosynthesis B2 protein n=1 Tax=Saccharopolyspora cebuensis TaxID=418759 RepID=A0ABV4CEI0_9PSEU
MTTPETLPYDPGRVPVLRRWSVRALSWGGGALAAQSPQRVARVLSAVSRGARPATVAEAARARLTLERVSLPCAGREGCLRRSITVALLCRLRGCWPTWHVGVRKVPPLAAHAWVEAEGVPVGENVSADYFRPLLSVPPAAR